MGHAAPRADWQNMPGREYVNLNEAGAIIGVSAATIRRRIADGSLTGYRFGPRALRVRRADVEAMATPTNAWA